MTINLTPGASHFTCPAQEVEIGDVLIDGTVALVRGAASPRGVVEFTFEDGTTTTYSYNGTVIVLTSTGRV